MKYNHGCHVDILQILLKCLVFHVKCSEYCNVFCCFVFFFLGIMYVNNVGVPLYHLGKLFLLTG